MIPLCVLKAMNPYAYSAFYWRTVANSIPTLTPSDATKDDSMPSAKAPSKTPIIITMNVGSSSVKFSIVDAASLSRLAVGKVAGIGAKPALDVKDIEHGKTVKEAVEARDIMDAIARVMEWIQINETDHTIGAVAHRVVHGGATFKEPCLSTPAILKELEKLIPFTPLHQPFNIAGVRAAENVAPNVPQVLCFDTSFHTTNPDLHSMLPLPKEIQEKGARRFGFHGLAYESVLEQLEKTRPDLLNKRLVLTQMGSGSSACAVVNGQSIASTMGLTVLGGLPMGTRTGDMDPGVVLYLQMGLGMSTEDVQKMLYNNAGLKGISGISPDAKVLEDDGSPDARRALAYYILKAAQHIAGMSVAAGGMQALIFSGGIGENGTAIREAILDHLKPACADFEVLVVPADEESVLARYAAGFMKQQAA